MGLDLLKKCHATIYCSPEGVYMTRDPNVVRARQCLSKDAPLPAEFRDVPPTLWATGDTDVGLLKIPPVSIRGKDNAILPRIPQYKIPQAGERVLLQIIQYLIEKGVVEETNANVCNSPILPILKRAPPGTSYDHTDVYRFVIDLRKINKIVVPQFPVVPDITALLTMIPSTA